MVVGSASGLRRVQATWKLAGEGADTAGYARVRQLLATTMTALRRVPSQSAVEVAADSWAHKMLHALSRRGDMRSAELLNLLDAHPSEISRTGGRLEQRGMVARARAGKETWWSITNRGRAALARVDAAASPQRLLEVRGPDMDDAMARLEDAVSKVTAHRQRVQLIVAELLVAQIGELDRRIAMWKGPREFMQDAPEYRMLTPGLPTDANRTFLWETLADVVDSAQTRDSMK